MPASVVTLILLVELLDPGRPVASYSPSPSEAVAAVPEKSDPLWSVTADESRPSDPEPRPELDGVTPTHEWGGPDPAAEGMTGASAPVGDDGEPICIEDFQCSSIPTERSGVIPSLRSFKGLITSPVLRPTFRSQPHREPMRLGDPCRGFIDPPFRPPR